MKKAIQSFGFWLLKLSGYKVANGGEVEIKVSVNDQATSAIEAISAKAEDAIRKLENLSKFTADIQPVKAQAESVMGTPFLKPVQSDPNTIDCEICGCMVSKAKAIKGKGEMRDRIITMYECGNMPIEFIYYPHYCKRCAPKDKGQTRQRKKIDIK